MEAVTPKTAGYTIINPAFRNPGPLSLRATFQQRLVLLNAALILTLACSCRPDAPQSGAKPQEAASPVSGTPTYTYKVVNAWPHDHDAFTQGLVYLNGVLLESTGIYGKSSLRRVELTTGRVLQKVPIPPDYFAEGLAFLGGKLYQLSWQNQTGFVYDEKTFQREGQFSYTGEGWGLTTDGASLILSDGTDRIRFLDPLTFDVMRSINVADRGRPILRLNELEYIKGEIYANVWQTQFIVRINPDTGAVTGWIDLTGLLSPADRDATVDVVNGIAYDEAGDRLFVTGKFWPKLYEIRLERKP